MACNKADRRAVALTFESFISMGKSCTVASGKEVWMIASAAGGGRKTADVHKQFSTLQTLANPLQIPAEPIRTTLNRNPITALAVVQRAQVNSGLTTLTFHAI